MAALAVALAALTCLGYTNPQIAARLGLAMETVRTHTRNVQIKFNVNSKGTSITVPV